MKRIFKVILIALMLAFNCRFVSAAEDHIYIEALGQFLTEKQYQQLLRIVAESIKRQGVKK